MMRKPARPSVHSRPSRHSPVQRTYEENSYQETRKISAAASFPNTVFNSENTRSAAMDRRSSDARLSRIDERIAEKKHYRRRLVLKRLCAGAIGLACAAILVWLFGFSSVFAASLSRTDISGADKGSIIPVNEVRDIVRQYEGTPLIVLGRGAMESQLEQIPEIADAQVHIRFPRTLAVDLVPERPYACWGKGEGCVPLSADGSRLRIPDDQKEILMNVIVDSGSDDPHVFMATLTEVYGDFDATLKKRIVEARVHTGRQLSFVLDTGATVQWGTAEDSDLKQEVLHILLQENHQLYDVSMPSSPVTQ